MRYNLKDLKDAQEELECARDNMKEILEEFIDYFQSMIDLCDDLDLDVIDISTLSGE